MKIGNGPACILAMLVPKAKPMGYILLILRGD
jgi:hypothetical protein